MTLRYCLLSSEHGGKSGTTSVVLRVALESPAAGLCLCLQRGDRRDRTRGSARAEHQLEELPGTSMAQTAFSFTFLWQEPLS